LPIVQDVAYCTGCECGARSWRAAVDFSPPCSDLVLNITSLRARLSACREGSWTVTSCFTSPQSTRTGATGLAWRWQRVPSTRPRSSIRSFLHGGWQSGMKEKRTGRSSVNEGGDWKRLRSQSDGRIRRGIESDPDARPTDAEFWKKARVVMRTTRQTVTIRLDADLLECLRLQKATKRESMPCCEPIWTQIGPPENRVERISWTWAGTALWRCGAGSGKRRAVHLCSGYIR
jgi:uncharacterized protein (DUF4415 family)